MRLGLTASVVGWEEKKLMQSFSEKGMDLIFLDDNKEFYPLEISSALDGVLIRNQNFVRGICLAKYHAMKGVSTINTADQIMLCANKFFLTALLKESGFPVVETSLAFTKDAGLAACRQLGFPVVIKPLYGGHGHLVSLAETENAASGILESRAILGHNFQKAFYIQKYIPLIHDIRVITVGQEPLCAIRRKNQKEWRHNTSQGAVAESFEITNAIRELISKTLKIIGPGIFGFDFFETPDGFVVNEVNHVCQFKNPSMITHTNVAACIADYVKESFS